MNNLLTQCNADVFAAILEIKESQPKIGEKFISILQKYESAWEMPAGDMLWFSAHLPFGIWDLKVHTFHLLFQSQQTKPKQ